MRYSISGFILFSFFISFSSIAKETVSVYLSEDGQIVMENETMLDQTYVVGNNLKEFNPKNKNDAASLADSIEFEVYSVTENSQIHTIFMSGAGVCKGYSGSGVEITDSTTYYINELSDDEYYANIARGTLNARGDAKNLQFASVFNISDLERSKQFKEQEAKYGKDIAEQNLRNRTKVLSKLVCKKK